MQPRKFFLIVSNRMRTLGRVYHGQLRSLLLSCDIFQVPVNCFVCSFFHHKRFKDRGVIFYFWEIHAPAKWLVVIWSKLSKIRRPQPEFPFFSLRELVETILVFFRWLHLYRMVQQRSPRISRNRTRDLHFSSGGKLSCVLLLFCSPLFRVRFDWVLCILWTYLCRVISFLMDLVFLV